MEKFYKHECQREMSLISNKVRDTLHSNSGITVHVVEVVGAAFS